MGEIYQEFKEELENLSKKYRNRPDKEINKLLHIALEREELVTTAYRAHFLEGNVDRLPVQEELKEIIKHALIWVWKDEDMHTIYTRGALLKSTGLFQKIKIALSQFQGFLGGWAGSTVQHVKFKDAPLSVSFASILVFFGKISGKISKGIGKELKFGSFKQFCYFNIDAEKTAKICWERILALAKNDDRFSEEYINDFQRIIFDEDRHEQIFGIIYAILEPNDQTVKEFDLNTVIQEIKAVSDYFLPKKYRSRETHPVGNGGKVWSFLNKTDQKKHAFFETGLLQTDLIEKVNAIAEEQGKKTTDLSIVIKISISMGYDQKDLSPITDPQLLEALCKQLFELGINDIKVIDIDSIYIQFFKNRSVPELAAYFGFESPYYTIINASEELVYHEFSRGIGNYAVSETWKNADFRINLSKVRSHPIEMALVSINNLEWLTGNTKEFVFIDRIVDRQTTTNMLIDDFPPHYTILDAYDNIPDGILGVMGSKKPIAPQRFYFSADPLALDRVVMKHLKFTKIPKKGTLQSAIHWFGAEEINFTVIGEDSEIDTWTPPTKKVFWAFLSFMSYPVYLFFSKRGQLFVPKMDEKAFPAKTKPSHFIRMLRSFNRWITNLPN